MAALLIVAHIYRLSEIYQMLIDPFKRLRLIDLDKNFNHKGPLINREQFVIIALQLILIPKGHVLILPALALILPDQLDQVFAKQLLNHQENKKETNNLYKDLSYFYNNRVY